MALIHRPLIVACALALLAGTAEAQSSPGNAPIEAASPPTAQSSAGNAPIEMGSLVQLDAWTVGAIGRGQGALPDTLWANSNPAQLGALFDRVPASFNSPAAIALARRALASAGQAPSGEGAAEAARKRFSALGRLGLADEISVMAAGAVPADPEIVQFAAQAELARGRLDDACQRGRLTSGDRLLPFLLRLRAYCAAAAGETAAADLALEVARTANANDPWLRSAIQAIATRPPRPPAAKFDTSLNAAASISARLRPGAGALTNSSSLALLVLARMEGAPQSTRAQAAALAFRRGILSAQLARDAIRLPDAQTTNLPPLGGAIRQVETQPRSLAAAAAIARVLRSATLYVDFAAASRLFHDDIAALENAPDAASAALFARAAAASGDMALAARLTESASQAGVSTAALAPIRAAMAASEPQGSLNAELAIRRRLEAANAQTAAQVSRDLSILGALDFPLDAGARAHLLANPPRGGRAPDAGLAAALASAAQTRAIGETALLASLAIAQGAQTLETNALVEAIRALRAVGLDDSARGVAVEALLGGAPPGSRPG